VSARSSVVQKIFLYIKKTMDADGSRKRNSCSTRELVDKGFLQPVKRGRPTIYATEEERKAAFRAQQKVCMKKHAERVKEAKRCMLEAEADNAENLAV
jgi:hypothetical protein